MQINPFVVAAPSFEPYKNQALEEYILESLSRAQIALYLWRNADTVVIGRNQSCFAECRVSALEADGGKLARRLSGGGAVFHDINNLNFTFVADRNDYDLARQLSVVCRAVQSFGVSAQLSGRNDIEAHGRKFSGNAFYTRGRRCLHHGTILIDADTQKLEKYLSASAKKLKSKGVASVRSRVINLNELCAGITAKTMADALVAAFESEYGAAQQQDICEKDYSVYVARFASEEWIYGAAPMSAVAQSRFSWGDFSLEAEIAHGEIEKAAVYSDCLDYQTVCEIERSLVGCFFSAERICGRLASLKNGENDCIIDDVADCIKNNVD